MPPAAEPRFLIDTSVWSRLVASGTVANALRALVNAARPSAVYLCPPTAAGYGFSSRTGPDHTMLMGRLAAFTGSPRTASSTKRAQSVAARRR